MPTLPYDPARDLVPLTLLFRATFVILVGGRSRFGTLAQLLDAARREPGRVSYASLGNGHASQVAIESMAQAAGVQLLHVPFKDAGALFTAVASADVDFTAFSMNTVAGLLAGGKLRPLAVAARRRLKDHPELPTLAEAGGPAVEMHPWAGLVAPAGTPPAVLEQLQRDIAAAIDSNEVRARVAGDGLRAHAVDGAAVQGPRAGRPGAVRAAGARRAGVAALRPAEARTRAAGRRGRYSQLTKRAASGRGRIGLRAPTVPTLTKHTGTSPGVSPNSRCRRGEASAWPLVSAEP